MAGFFLVAGRVASASEYRLHQVQLKTSSKLPANPEKARRRRRKGPVLLQDRERHRLLYGPYEPPLVKRGFLVDAVRGTVEFSHFTNALIPWPKSKKRGKGGSGGFVLCGDLLRALAKEAGAAIAHHWGVSRATITNWRNALGLKGRTEGAQRLINLGVELAGLPESRKKIADARRGRTLSARHKARLFAGIRGGWQQRFEARRAAYRSSGRFPKATKSDPWIPEEGRLLPKLPTQELVRVLGRTAQSIRARRILLDIRARPAVVQQPWRQWELKLLGTDSDSKIAKQLGRSAHAVEAKRHDLAIKASGSKLLWTQAERETLGTVSDAKAAQLLGRSVGAVAHQRRMMGLILVQMQKPRAWTRSEIALLGTDNEAAVAKKVGRSRAAVRSKRVAEAIPSKLESRLWTPKEIAALGTMSDIELSRKLGRTPVSVAVKRHRVKIPPSQNRRWSPAEDKLLGTMPDAEAARRCGREPGAARMRRTHLGIPMFESKVKYWKQWELDLLGTASDEDVARKTGRAVLAVKSKRQQLRILSANPRVVAQRRVARIPVFWTREREALLGTMPDEELAKRLGRTRSAVTTRRQRLGIPSVVPWLRPWRTDELKLLGKVADSEVARRTGHSDLAVATKRRSLRLRDPGAKLHPWTPEEDALIGRFPDKEVARRLNRSVLAVKSRRGLLGMSRLFARRKWTPSQDRLLGAAPDQEIATKLSRTKIAVRNRRRTLRIPTKRRLRVN